jgi:hypothetical protein
MPDSKISVADPDFLSMPDPPDPTTTTEEEGGF